ncbi:PEGA domain-containing protein [Thermococcus prieurii]
MKKRIVAVVWVVLLIGAVLVTPKEVAAEKTNGYWVKTYGPGEITDTKILQDGDIIAVGYAYTTTGKKDVLVAKLSSNGRIIWANTYGGNEDDRANAVAVTPTGNIIVVGWTKSFGNNEGSAWILKLDSNGNIIWQKTYNDGDTCYFDTVGVSPEGDIIVAGSVYIPTPGRWEAWILKLDENGNIIWKKTYSGGSGEITTIKVTSSGNILAVGTFHGDIWVAQLDSSGNIDSQRVLRPKLSKDEEAEIGINSVAQTSNGDIILAGWIWTFIVAPGSYSPYNPDGIIIKLSRDKNIIWSHVYGGNRRDFFKSVQVVKGDIIAAGSSNNAEWVVKLGPDGTPIWQRAYYSGRINSISYTNDSLILGGTYIGYTEQDAQILKIPLNGIVDGAYSNITLNSKNLEFLESYSVNLNVTSPTLQTMESNALVAPWKPTVYTLYTTTGYLQINSSPSGANIYINGTYVGTSPIKLTLNSGYYNVTITKEGYLDYKKLIKITPGKTTSIYANLTPSIASLIAYYSFNTCDATDDSGNGHDGTIQGNIRCAQGVMGKALNFTDYLQVVKLPNSILNGLRYTTITFWIKTTNGIQGILSGANENYDNELLIFMGNGSYTASYHNNFGRVELLLHEQFVMYSPPINDGKWHMVTLVLGPSFSKMYIDGRLVNQSTIGTGSGLNISKNGLWVGNDQDCVGGCWDSGQQFKGALDELRFYQGILNASTIEALYEQGEEALEKQKTANSQETHVGALGIVTLKLNESVIVRDANGNEYNITLLDVSKVSQRVLLRITSPTNPQFSQVISPYANDTHSVGPINITLLRVYIGNNGEYYAKIKISGAIPLSNTTTTSITQTEASTGYMIGSETIPGFQPSQEYLKNVSAYAIQKAEELIGWMEENGYQVLYAEKYLDEAKNAYNNADYKTAKELALKAWITAWEEWWIQYEAEILKEGGVDPSQALSYYQSEDLNASISELKSLSSGLSGEYAKLFNSVDSTFSTVQQYWSWGIRLWNYVGDLEASALKFNNGQLEVAKNLADKALNTVRDIGSMARKVLEQLKSLGRSVFVEGRGGKNAQNLFEHAMSLFEQGKFEQAKKVIVQVEEIITVTTTQKKHGICGPAFILGLALIPLFLRKRRG